MTKITNNQAHNNDKFQTDLICIFDKLEEVNYEKEKIFIETREKPRETKPLLFLQNYSVRFRYLDKFYRCIVKTILKLNQIFKNRFWIFLITPITLCLLAFISFLLRFYFNLYFDINVYRFLIIIFLFYIFLLALYLILDVLSFFIKAKKESEKLPRKVINIMRRYAGISEKDETEEILILKDNLTVARELGEIANAQGLEYAKICVNKLLEDRQDNHRVTSEILPLILSGLTLAIIPLLLGEQALNILKDFNDLTKTILGVTTFLGYFR